MIPSFNISNVLPPFQGADPTLPTQVSPYEVTMSELVATFATSPERIEIIKGFMTYRARLAQLNIIDGFQLIDGSFVENCEVSRGRAPADVDLVTFARVNIAQSGYGSFIQNNQDVFNTSESKRLYKCDAYFVDLDKDPQIIADDSFYWFGLFSHQRATSLWKGMLKIPLQSDDHQVRLI